MTVFFIITSIKLTISADTSVITTDAYKQSWDFFKVIRKKNELTIKTIVATNLVGSNILFSWFIGPFKNIVL
jgi:hypothetical protein